MTLKLDRIVKALAPAIALALAAWVSACDGAAIRLNGEEGKKLADLDLSGAPPHELVLLGPDEVHITQGDRLAIQVDGDAEARDALRFTLKDGSLGIARKDKLFEKSGKTAVITVTMPAPREVVMAGSGKIAAQALAGAAKVTVAGSGDIETPGVTGDKLDLTIAGSGNFRGAGNVKTLDLTIAGSGSAAMDALRAESAKVTIAGSGDATFSSDGEVDARIVGSGNVTVKGRARCKLSSMGSGKLVCETVTAAK